jgi:hypothetical protein
MTGTAAFNENIIGLVFGFLVALDSGRLAEVIQNQIGIVICNPPRRLAAHAFEDVLPGFVVKRRKENPVQGVAEAALLLEKALLFGSSSLQGDSSIKQDPEPWISPRSQI